MTYNNRNSDSHQPALENDREVLLEVANNPSNTPEGQNDPIKEKLCKFLSLVVHVLVRLWCNKSEVAFE